MGQEIERKFLVTSNSFKELAINSYPIKQGYLSTVPDRTVRIRIKGNKAFITIKGKSNESGTSRFEWEKEIDLHDAEELLTICETGKIDKIRYEVPNGKFTFEVDEFYGENEGLVIAEIELNNENDTFEIPDWIGEEVTGDSKYYNSSLIKNPFAKW